MERPVWLLAILLTQLRRKCKLRGDSRQPQCSSRFQRLYEEKELEASIGRAYLKSGLVNLTFKRNVVVPVFCSGALPPLMGSGIYRSVQFAVFEAAYTYMDNTFASETALPVLQGLQLRVIIGGLLSATSRAIIETPLEFAKVRRQTGQTWNISQVYQVDLYLIICSRLLCMMQGFTVTWIRTAGLMTSYFITVDYLRRTKPDFFKSVLGPFFISGVAATAAWWLVWPFENMKSQVQAGYGGKMPLWRRLRLTVKEKGGFFALYRGIGPGSIRSFLANGSSMLVMQWAQRKVSQLGLRN
eukprot:m.19850 g.19850  ORF g.19850 m.19850 type:complete len:299 (+) comp27914_c0_seq6:193-1089(+)